ncbi:hypothetical protein BH10ACT9_BH10ACT9_06240 [soil metagenome]
MAAALRGGAQVSVTVRLDSKVESAIATIDDHAWTPIEYTDALYDESSGQWISRAEVAEIAFTAFSSKKASQHVPGRLVVRRIPDLNPTPDAQATLFDTWRFHAFFTTTDLDTVTADKSHRGHAIIDQVHADLKASALAHLPSGRFAANGAWLVLTVMAFNLTRAAATLTGTRLAKARTATIRRTLISVPALIASSARRLTLHLPRAGCGKQRGTPCSTIYSGDISRSSPNTTPHPALDAKDQQEQPDTEVGPSPTPSHHLKAHNRNQHHPDSRSVHRGLDMA